MMMASVLVTRGAFAVSVRICMSPRKCNLPSWLPGGASIPTVETTAGGRHFPARDSTHPADSRPGGPALEQVVSRDAAGSLEGIARSAAARADVGLMIGVVNGLIDEQGVKRARSKTAAVARSFAGLLEQTRRQCPNRAVETAQVIEELSQRVREMREAKSRGEGLGLTDDELAFYDALETNDSALQVLGDETLKTIARRAGGHRPEEHHDRLDDPGERARS